MLGIPSLRFTPALKKQIMMDDKFFEAIRQYKMLTHGDTVCVAVSGGADSMCLLQLLYENSQVLGISVAAAHVNHCIRGNEADRDEKYVRDYCDKLSIPFHCVRIDIPKIAKEKGIGTELCARNERYAFFETLPYSKIATAHTGSDSVETMLMNLSRGASLHGLCSIPPVRGRIIRPLIYFTREDTEKYCRQNQIEYVTDSTNLTEDYTRNKFRHSVLGILKNINISFEQNALRCLSSLREDEAYLSYEARVLFDTTYDKQRKALNADTIKKANPAIAKRVLAIYFGEILGSDYEFRHIKAFYDSLDKKTAITLPSGVTVLNENGEIKEAIAKKKIIPPDSVVFNTKDGFSGYFGKYRITVEVNYSPCDYGSADAVLDLDKLGDKIEIHSKRPGDKITVAGRHCTKTLKKLFTEKKIAVDSRPFIPVFSDGSGVIYVHGCGVSAYHCKSSKTKNFLIIKTECDKNDE